MSSPLSLSPNAIVHQDDAASGMKANKLQTPKASVVATTRAPEPQKAPEFNFKADSLAMSFAYDSVAQSLNIVMTDKTSGEIIRKITYKHIPPDVHQADKLQGLLLDQMA